MKKEASANIELGVKIKNARALQGKTLKELSEACGATPSFISQVERGIVSPSLESLRKISAALGMPMTVFFEGADKPPPRSALKRTAITYDGKTGSTLEEAIVMLAETKMRPVFITLEPGGEIAGDVLRSGGEMFVLVLEGALEVDFQGASARIYAAAAGGCAEISLKGERFVLTRGDSFYSGKGARPGRAANPLSKPARLMCVAQAGQ